ncbi:hypothetical protein C1H46_026360 [Malus baccata]|uniref:Uncharacterized protein n=1 Tax=Malus baccata TaxID=106549 RepID=A0A540LNL5_MALBA|nr:hypothetical protein C1H46_026360 [Malus baccata]
MSEAETLEVPSPAASGIVADGVVREEAWNPSFTEQLLAETHKVFAPTAFGIVDDGGGIEEAWSPSFDCNTGVIDTVDNTETFKVTCDRHSGWTNHPVGGGGGGIAESLAKCIYSLFTGTMLLTS